MSDEKQLPAVTRSRQDILDELYYVQDVAGQRDQRILELEVCITEKDTALAEKDTALAEKDAALAEKDAALAEKDATLAEKRTTLELMLRTRSWRMTVPLRALSHLFGTIRHRTAPVPDSRPSLTDDAAKGVASMSAELPQEATQRMPPFAAPPAHREPQDVKPRLWVDVTELAIKEGRTGVQRVTREMLRAWLAAPPEGYHVEPVYAAPGRPYRHARAFIAKFVGGVQLAVDDEPLHARSGDVFVGLDHSMQAVVEHAEDLAGMSERGVRIWFVCSDTLPLSRPDWFPSDVPAAFKAWVEVMARVGDGIACISYATELSLRRWLDAFQVPRTAPLALAHFHLGADIAPPVGDADITQGERAVVASLQGKTSFLMVGTLEPRKGHAQALEAFECLWASGEDVTLVLVGLPGWMTDVTARRIRHHDEFGKRLLWFVGATDAVLEKLYTVCTALLAPSEGEGFGLPLIEAARHSLPILCRDLPVFQEVAGKYANYFTGYDAAPLAAAIQHWLTSFRNGTTFASTEMPWLTWAQSASQLLTVVLGTRRNGIWLPGRSFWFPVSDPRMGLTNARFEDGRVVSDGIDGTILRTWPIAVRAGRYDLEVRGEWLEDVGVAGVELSSLSRPQPVAQLSFTAAEVQEQENNLLRDSAIELKGNVDDLVIWINGTEGTRLAIEGCRLSSEGYPAEIGQAGTSIDAASREGHLP